MVMCALSGLGIRSDVFSAVCDKGKWCGPLMAPAQRSLYSCEEVSGGLCNIKGVS